MRFGLRENVRHADWIHLVDDEQVRWSGRPSRFTLVPAIAIMVGLVLLGVVLSIIVRSVVVGLGWPAAIGYLPLLVAVGGLGYGLFAYLKWVRLLYVITDEEIYVKIGLISRDVTQVPLTRVQNTSYSQSMLERLLSFGDIHVYTAGTHTEDIVLENVPNPKHIKATLTAQVSRRHAEAPSAAGAV